MLPNEPRRLVILTEGQFNLHDAKTALGVIRYGRDEILAILDSTMVGRNLREVLPGFDVPFVATLDEAFHGRVRPDGLLIGIAPTGGRLPGDWRMTILEAIRAGLDIHSGLHQFLGDDPEFVAAAAAAGTRLIDYRRPPDRMETSVGRRHLPGKRVILTVGTDCAIGKMSVALELVAAARRDGASAAMVPTGQTGMMIEGWGVAVDRVISDFTNGTVEWLVEQGEERADWVIVEGQGSIDHPAYSAVTMGLIHGATPHAMVLVHKPGLVEHDFTHLPGGVVPDRGAAAVHRAARADRRARRAVEGRRPWRSTPRSTRRTTRRGPSSRRSRPRPGCPPTTRSDSAPTASGRRSAMPWRPCRGSDRQPRGPVAGPARPVPDRPLGPQRRDARSRRSSSSCATSDIRASSGWGRATRTASTARRPRRWRPSGPSCSLPPVRTRSI